MKTTINGVTMPSKQECIDKLGFDLELVDPTGCFIEATIRHLQSSVSRFKKYSKDIEGSVSKEKSDKLDNLLEEIEQQVEYLKDYKNQLEIK